MGIGFGYRTGAWDSRSLRSARFIANCQLPIGAFCNRQLEMGNRQSLALAALRC
jgi:hypothetical protein